MKIGGLQKLTLLDYPGRLACTVFLSGCNLRCPFCHNGGLVLPEQMTQEIPEAELLDFLKRRQGKLEGVCITGGEPTIYEDLPGLTEKIRELGFSVKLDTNGSHPQMVKKLLDRDLIQYVAMDVKNCPEAYRETVGGADILKAVTETRDLLLGGNLPYEFRTTVCHPLHSPERMEKLARWIRGADQYFIQNFVDSVNLVGEGMTPFSEPELEDLLAAARTWIPGAEIRGQ